MKKKFDIIPIEDYGVVVDKEAKTPDGNWVYNNRLNGVFQINDKNRPSATDSLIIATINKRIDDIPLIEIKKDIRQMAAEANPYTFRYNKDKQNAANLTTDEYRRRWVAGYKAAGGYSEEDMRKAFKAGTNHGGMYQMLVADEDWDATKEMDKEGLEPDFQKCLKSLQPKLPKSVVLEMELVDITRGTDMNDGYEIKITNPSTNTIIPISYE